MNIAWWVERWSVLHPHKTAIIFEGDRISYLDIHRKINRTCCWLQTLGIEKGDRVAVMRDGRIQRGDVLLLEAFGGGFTWGSALIRY